MQNDEVTGRDTTNDTDSIFATGGEPALVEVQPVGDGHLAAVCLLVPSAP